MGLINLAKGLLGNESTASSGLKRSGRIDTGHLTTLTAKMPKISSTGVDIVEEYLIFEGVVSESHTANSTFTNNPVEFGPVITDHRINQPRTLTLTATVTDNPLHLPVNNWGADVSGQTYSKAAWAKLNDIRENSYPFELVSGLQVYNNMLIANMSCSQDVDSLTALNITINFKEVIVVKSRTEAVTKESVSQKVYEQTSETAEEGSKATRDGFAAGVGYSGASPISLESGGVIGG